MQTFDWRIHWSCMKRLILIRRRQNDSYLKRHNSKIPLLKLFDQLLLNIMLQIRLFFFFFLKSYINRKALEGFVVFFLSGNSGDLFLFYWSSYYKLYFNNEYWTLANWTSDFYFPLSPYVFDWARENSFFNWASVIMSDFFSSFDQTVVLFLKRYLKLLCQRFRVIVPQNLKIFKLNHVCFILVSSSHFATSVADSLSQEYCKPQWYFAWGSIHF